MNRYELAETPFVSAEANAFGTCESKVNESINLTEAPASMSRSHGTMSSDQPKAAGPRRNLQFNCCLWVLDFQIVANVSITLGECHDRKHTEDRCDGFFWGMLLGTCSGKLVVRVFLWGHVKVKVMILPETNMELDGMAPCKNIF